jgi:hypothetical protein
LLSGEPNAHDLVSWVRKHSQAAPFATLTSVEDAQKWEKLSNIRVFAYIPTGED